MAKTYFWVDIKGGDVSVLIEFTIAAALETLAAISVDWLTN